MGGLLWAGPALSANEMRFSELEPRLAAVEQKTAAMPGLRTAAFLSDEEAIDAIAPNDSTEGEGEVISSSHTTLGKSGGGATCDCGSSCEGGNCGDTSSVNLYADVELMFLRAHLAESSVGKLSEKYEFSPRFVVGYESDGGVGARVRYWTYGRTTPILDDEPDIRFEFEVLDIEATSRFRTGRSELVVGGGFRFATVDIEYDNAPISNNMPGITFAADMRTYICGDCSAEWSAVYGARISALGGDWDGSEDALIEPNRDDNIITQELYAGVEYVQRFETCNMFTRLVFEMQNWHSGALSDNANTDSIGMVGPGIHAGATF
jgi:hypothetical protein